jgi:hypothetical protein
VEGRIAIVCRGDNEHTLETAMPHVVVCQENGSVRLSRSMCAYKCRKGAGSISQGRNRWMKMNASSFVVRTKEAVIPDDQEK